MTDIAAGERGLITFTVVSILSVLTILGICGSSISRIELQISRNEAVSRNNFYVAEGGAVREAQEIGNGGYPVHDIHTTCLLATDQDRHLPAPSPHAVAGCPYEFTVRYAGYAAPDKGFSAIAFNRYDYEIEVVRNGARIRSRYCKIGPKPDQK